MLGRCHPPGNKKIGCSPQGPGNISNTFVHCFGETRQQHHLEGTPLPGHLGTYPGSAYTPSVSVSGVGVKRKGSIAVSTEPRKVMSNITNVSRSRLFAESSCAEQIGNMMDDT